MAFYNVTINPVPLGKLAPTPGTAIRLTANLTGAYGNANSAEDLHANRIELTAPAANAGTIFVGTSNMDKTTQVGVLKIIKAGETWSYSNPVGMNTVWVGTLFVDASNGGDSVNGSALVI